MTLIFFPHGFSGLVRDLAGPHHLYSLEPNRSRIARTSDCEGICRAFAGGWPRSLDVEARRRRRKQCPLPPIGSAQLIVEADGAEWSIFADPQGHRQCSVPLDSFRLIGHSAPGRHWPWRLAARTGTWELRGPLGSLLTLTREFRRLEGLRKENRLLGLATIGTGGFNRRNGQTLGTSKVSKHLVADGVANRAEWMAHPVVQRYRQPDVWCGHEQADWLVSGFLPDGSTKAR